MMTNAARLKTGIALSVAFAAALQMPAKSQTTLRFRDPPAPAGRKQPVSGIAFDESPEVGATQTRSLPPPPTPTDDSGVQFDTSKKPLQVDQQRLGKSSAPRQIASPHGTSPTSTGYDTPGHALDLIGEDLRRVGAHESQALEKIRRGFARLEQSTEHLRQQALRERNAVDAERRRALRAEQVADDAKRSAKIAQEVAVQTISRLKEIERQMQEKVNSSSAEPPQEGGISPQASTALAVPSPTTTLSPTPEPTVESVTTPHLPATRPITVDVVDRERLADSLFGAGEYRMALRLYRDLLQEAAPGEDQVWFTYQLACCLRHLGDWAQAEKFYRRVAANEEASYLADTSRWWLSVVDDHRQLEEQLELWRGHLSEAKESR